MCRTPRCHNGRPLGLSGCRQLLERDVTDVADLRLDLDLLGAEPPLLAAGLRFDCRPLARFLGLDVCGRRVRFSENVIYRVEDHRISQVWSVVEPAAIEHRLVEPDSEGGPSTPDRPFGELAGAARVVVAGHPAPVRGRWGDPVRHTTVSARSSASAAGQGCRGSPRPAPSWSG